MNSILSVKSNFERQELLNQTACNYDKNVLIHQLIERQAKEVPNKTAIIYKDQKITYKELNEKSNKIALYLRENGLSSDDIVCFISDRSLNMMIGILGILKSGASYLPIDPSLPVERIAFMAKNSGSLMILCNTYKGLDIESDVPIVKFSEAIEENKSTPVNHVNHIGNSHDLAYVIYTSGTTGNPKGVMIEHRMVIN